MAGSSGAMQAWGYAEWLQCSLRDRIHGFG
jgi:hypothetical protein